MHKFKSAKPMPNHNPIYWISALGSRFVRAVILTTGLVLASLPSTASDAHAGKFSQVAQSELPENLSRFLGTWGDGKWDGKLSNTLIVLSIDESGNAIVMYRWGAYSTWGIYEPGETRVRAKIVGNVLELDRFSNGAKVAYEMSGETLRGTYKKGATASKVVLKKSP